jgi:hypothetical protein
MATERGIWTNVDVSITCAALSARVLGVGRGRCVLGRPPLDTLVGEVSCGRIALKLVGVRKHGARLCFCIFDGNGVLLLERARSRAHSFFVWFFVWLLGSVWIVGSRSLVQFVAHHASPPTSIYPLIVDGKR